jgi:hypothetical protein
MWQPRWTALRFKGLGRAIAHRGPLDLRAMRREGAAYSQEKPYRCCRYRGSYDFGACSRRRVGSVRARAPPLDPGDRYGPRVSCFVQWGRCLDEASESPCRAPSRSATGSFVGCVDQFNAWRGQPRRCSTINSHMLSEGCCSSTSR